MNEISMTSPLIAGNSSKESTTSFGDTHNFAQSKLADEPFKDSYGTQSQQSSNFAFQAPPPSKLRWEDYPDNNRISRSSGLLPISSRNKLIDSPFDIN